jgi:hypothetical protein
MSNSTSKAPNVYQMKVTLKDIQPPIWRRFQVPGHLTFYQLHLILQMVMGWENHHLYQFVVDGQELSDPTTATEFGLKNAEETSLHQLLHQEKKKFVYEYDLGDGWEHEVLLEEILPLTESVPYPRCLAGERACPPEDCGGVWGYIDLMTVIADESHPDHHSKLDWLGGHFDPEAFDLDEVNDLLRRTSAPFRL